MTYYVAPWMTEDDLRRIIREELEAVLDAKQIQIRATRKKVRGE